MKASLDLAVGREFASFCQCQSSTTAAKIGTHATPKLPMCAANRFAGAAARQSSMSRPPYPQLQEVLANDELPGEVLLRQDQFVRAGIARHDMI